MQQLAKQLATEINAEQQQVVSAVKLLDEGATVPFIARYRKEATGGLDDAQLRTLEQRLGYLRELDDRKQVILKSITEQDKLTPQLEAAILGADNKTSLEDLYLPYKPKRRTKGQMAIEAGLEPLADQLFTDPTLSPEDSAQAFVNADKGVADVKAALDGAKFILMERFAENATLLASLRNYLKREAMLVSKVSDESNKDAQKFADYFSHSELLRKVPSHRALAMFRGRNEGILALSLDADPAEEKPVKYSHAEQIISEHFSVTNRGRAADKWLAGVVQWTWKVKLSGHLENELLGDLRERAESEAISVFARNLRDLLMASPAGAKVSIGLDPGIRTGVKVAVIDQTGKLLQTTTIYPHQPQNHWDKSVRTLTQLCRQFNVELIAIGNGTASRETDKLAGEVLKAVDNPKLNKIMVSEAGASVYSASELASTEFPDLDVSLRGAVSIARRLQDPLAELVKIEPKSIGVGQYQHDVSQSALSKSLSAVVEDCVNAVGVDINTASVPLLTSVSGLNKTLAQNIVKFREENGRFNNRKELKKVSRLGPKAFEQSAGFLRIANGDNPLDSSGVHPESYPLVEAILTNTQNQLSGVIGNQAVLKSIEPKQFVTDEFGLPTVTDIIAELDKPGRDPRPEFKTASFKEGVETLADLKPNMTLEGVVTNVTNFGAFVDIGVHQDGLVHISSLTDKFVSDPHEVVKAGDIVKVKVLSVDADRKRISLTMRMNEEAQTSKAAQADRNQSKGPRKNTGKSKPQKMSTGSLAGGAMSDAFAAAFAKNKK